MPTHRLDRWLRARHLWFRIGLGIVAPLELLAWVFDWRLLAIVLVLPSTVLFYLVAIYLPRTPLERTGGKVHPRE